MVYRQGQGCRWPATELDSVGCHCSPVVNSTDIPSGVGGTSEASSVNGTNVLVGGGCRDIPYIRIRKKIGADVTSVLFVMRKFYEDMEGKLKLIFEILAA